MTVDIKTAEQDINRWLDFKGVKEAKREKLKDAIGLLIDGVCDGCLVVDDKHFLVQKLIRPFDGEQPIKEFRYKPFLIVGEVKIKSNINEDFFAYSCAYIAALTGLPTAVIKKLDVDDFVLAKAIVEFFS
jgi:hypothetical protein